MDNQDYENLYLFEKPTYYLHNKFFLHLLQV